MAAAANALSPRTPVDPLPSAGSPEQLVLGSKIEDPLPLVGEQLVDPLGANGREAPRKTRIGSPSGAVSASERIVPNPSGAPPPGR